MSRETGIEWTDATWNPIRGCSRVSEGCRHCYAEVVANRFCGPGSPYEGVVRIGADGKGTGQWNGEIKFVEERLLDPLRWKKPQRIFVNSMSDLFHEKVTDEMLDRIFAVMALCPQHTFQVLTKRPERMLRYLADRFTIVRIHNNSAMARFMASVVGEPKPPKISPLQKGMWPLPNVWLGVSVENQKTADERIPLLLNTPAAVRFLSVEPLLESVSFRWTKCERWIDWVIVGGESGPGARPMHPDWARSLRDQCKAAGVPFFFKQWGEHLPSNQTPSVPLKPNSIAPGQVHWLSLDGDSRPVGDGLKKTDDHLVYRVGKKVAGHLLDGEVLQQFPAPQAQSAPCNGVRA